jgi:hypothetical protein
VTVHGGCSRAMVFAVVVEGGSIVAKGVGDRVVDERGVGANPGGEFHTTPLKGTHSDDARGRLTRRCCRRNPSRLGSGAGALLDPGGQFLHLVIGAATFSHLLADLSVRVHHCGVVAATEGLPNPR